MKPFRLTAMLAIFAIVLVAGAAVGFPIAVERGAPYSITTSECLICGRSRTVDRQWKQSPKETIETHKQSLWMQPQIDSRHEHWWVVGSQEERPEWFAYASIGCGGVGGVSSLHYLATKKGDDVAGPVVLKYLQLVEERDLESILNFVRNDVQTALQDPPPEQQPIVE